MSKHIGWLARDGDGMVRAFAEHPTWSAESRMWTSGERSLPSEWVWDLVDSAPEAGATPVKVRLVKDG